MKTADFFSNGLVKSVFKSHSLRETPLVFIQEQNKS